MIIEQFDLLSICRGVEMKWFNCDSYFVVVVEKGDFYGADSTYQHNKSTPDIRIFDQAGIKQGEGYPLVLHTAYSTLKHCGLKREPLVLVNGDEVPRNITLEMFKEVESLLVNSGVLDRAAA